MIRTLLVFATVLATTPPVLAQSGAAQMRKACKADYDKFCAGTAPGGGRILQCLKTHAADLSPACRDVIEKQGQPG